MDHQVRLAAPLRINLTGYDREAAEFPAGECEVPEVVYDFVRRHPELGAALERFTTEVGELENVCRACGGETVVVDLGPAGADDGSRLGDFQCLQCGAFSGDQTDAEVAAALEAAATLAGEQLREGLDEELVAGKPRARRGKRGR